MADTWIDEVRTRQADGYEDASNGDTHTAFLEALKDVRHLLAEVDRLKAVLREVAIPSLRYCEQKFDYDDQARLNCEAALDG